MMTPANPRGFTALEIATSCFFGLDEPTPCAQWRGSPREALEQVLLETLRGGTCVIGFSGGRDSTLLLCVATDLARRHGLAEPIPATLLTGDATTGDRASQEHVMRHLGLQEWVRVAPEEELDFLGDLACSLLEQHGLLAVGSAHSLAPLLRQVPGATFVTGLDGDGLLAESQWLGIAPLPWPPTRRRARLLVRACMPASLRAHRDRHTSPSPIPWLRPEAQRAFDLQVSGHGAREPAWWPARSRWYRRQRFLRLLREALDVMATDEGVRLTHPFFDDRFVTAIGRAGRPFGFGSRESAMQQIAGDVLPPSILVREDKTLYGELFVGHRTREFVASWDGVSGIDTAVVDPDVLRACSVDHEWAGVTSLALQSAWLASRSTRDAIV